MTRKGIFMIKTLGQAGTHRRVAINVGAGFIPGPNPETPGGYGDENTRYFRVFLKESTP